MNIFYQQKVHHMMPTDAYLFSELYYTVISKKKRPLLYTLDSIILDCLTLSLCNPLIAYLNLLILRGGHFLPELCDLINETITLSLLVQ